MHRTSTTTLGMPRIGSRRELKIALEARWKGGPKDALDSATKALRKSRWEDQLRAGIDVVPSNDFSVYDHVLDASCLVGAIPERFGGPDRPVDDELRFDMARGRHGTRACAMTKWFDTNYHCIAPEVSPDTRFRIADTKPFDEFREALELGIMTRPVLLGPLTWLLLAQRTEACPRSFEPLDLVDTLVETYQAIVERLGRIGATWIQIDEPALREGLPLRHAERPGYFDWTRDAFRLASSPARPDVQIHTHMCYSSFSDIAELVAGLDADVISFEAARSGMSLLDDSTILACEAGIGPGVWDVHSPHIPSTNELVDLLEKARREIGAERLWVNPDCGLKTRGWRETIGSLKSLVSAAKRLRNEYDSQPT